VGAVLVVLGSIRGSKEYVGKVLMVLGSPRTIQIVLGSAWALSLLLGTKGCSYGPTVIVRSARANPGDCKTGAMVMVSWQVSELLSCDTWAMFNAFTGLCYVCVIIIEAVGDGEVQPGAAGWLAIMGVVN
jgi:hypothetical protein